MALFLFILLPLGWALTGRLAGLAFSLSAPSEAGQRLGARLGRWCMVLLPVVHLLLLFLGLSGNAGHGVHVFGSELLAEVLCLPVYLVPVFAGYVLVAFVVRDLAGKMRSFRQQSPLNE
jgi:hypothetical protein